MTSMSVRRSSPSTNAPTQEASLGLSRGQRLQSTRSTAHKSHPTFIPLHQVKHLIADEGYTDLLQNSTVWWFSYVDSAAGHLEGRPLAKYLIDMRRALRLKSKLFRAETYQSWFGSRGERGSMCQTGFLSLHRHLLRLRVEEEEKGTAVEDEPASDAESIAGSAKLTWASRRGRSGVVESKAEVKGPTLLEGAQSAQSYPGPPKAEPRPEIEVPVMVSPRPEHRATQRVELLDSWPRPQVVPYPQVRVLHPTVVVPSAAWPYWCSSRATLGTFSHQPQVLLPEGIQTAPEVMWMRRFPQ